MPELPDVEHFRRKFEETSLDKTIQKVEVKGKQMLKNISFKDLQHQLEGSHFVNTRRYGKFLFCKTSKDTWLVAHFGMTGNVVHFKKDKKLPKYAKLIFYFPHSATALTSIRKLGEFSITNDPDQYIQERGFGPDALHTDFESFYNKVKDRTAMIKSIFMNQHIISGIGNVYADEICYRLKLHPKTKVTKFGQEEWKKIYETMQHTLQKGITNKIDSSWLAQHREDDAECPQCRGKVKRIVIGSRGTYFCPSCQNRTLN
ncbi:MAG: DNA-formamidopyrimidine glycosylase family protein [Patescibacteria group bacterium]|nr:DNA-formamidopyrimidine glycosylase family protein [Patescibacteria group bacterium]